MEDGVRDESNRMIENVSGTSTDVISVPLDPNHSHEGFAEARAKGPVVTVSFSTDENSNGGADRSPDFRSFLEREHLFVTRYDEALAALVDNRISSDARTAMTPE